MSSIGGGNIVSDGLVLALDAGNVKSFRGEPTTNIIVNGNFIDGKNGWIFNGNSNALTTTGIYHGKSSIYVNGLQWYNENGSFVSIVNVNIGTTYTLSFEYYLISGNIRFDPDGAYGGDVTLTTTGSWVKYSTTFVASTYTWINFNFYGQFGVPSYYYLTNFQLEQKNHATAFTSSSRGVDIASGGGIIGLSGNNNHGILDTNLGGSLFKGVYALDFDSIGKHIVGTIINNQPTTDATIESWIFPKTEIDLGDSMGTIIVIKGESAIYQSLSKSNPPQLANYWYSHTPEGYFINGLSVRDQWHHWCSVWNYSDQKLYQYIDGVMVGNISTYGDAATGSSYVIGYEMVGRQFSGGIANIKVYNVALSNSQVLQNFNSTKSRFGL